MNPRLDDDRLLEHLQALDIMQSVQIPVSYYRSLGEISHILNFQVSDRILTPQILLFLLCMANQIPWKKKKKNNNVLSKRLCFFVFLGLN